MLTDTKGWQLDAEMQSVVPGEGACGATLAARDGVHAASITAHCKKTLMLFSLFTVFCKSKNTPQISFS